MKKLLVLILTVCLLTAPGAIAFAEESTDLSGYSDSELLTLLAEVQAEIAARKIDDYPSKLYEHKHGDDVYSVFVTIEEGDTLIIPFPYTLTISAGVMFK